MSDPIKFGPMWNRAVIDPNARAVKFRGRTICRFEDVAGLRLVELITSFEEEQLLNKHPDVEKQPREAELWVDAKSGAQHRIASAESTGLLLEDAVRAATELNVPLKTQRALIETQSFRAPKKV